MKFLVFSDLHHANPALIVRRAADYDGVIFLGDGADKLPALEGAAKVLYAVKGNCDGGSELPEELEITAAGKKLLLCHGHRYMVKYGLSVLADEAAKRGCAAALFGHTHTPCDRYENGLYLLNPGAASGYGATFGVLDVSREGILFSHVPLKN